MARKTPYLQLRGSTYTFRVRVPDDLRAHVGKNEIKKSLRTGELKEAQQLARLERVKLDSEWAALRRKLAPIPTAVLSEVEVWRLASKWFVNAEKGRFGEPLEISRHDAEVELSNLSDWDASSSAWYSRATSILADEGWAIDPASPAFLRLQEGLQRAAVESFRRAMLRTYPGTQMALDPHFASLSVNSSVQPVSPKVSFARLMDDVTNDPSRPVVREKTIVKREAHWRVIREFFGPDTQIETISRQHVKDFMRLLMRLPSNATKHFPNASIFEAAELGERKRLPPLSTDTANGYMRALGSLFRLAVKEGWTPSDPTVGLLFQRDKTRRKDKRLPFDQAELRAIFSAPLFTGCLDDERGYAAPGDKVVRRGRFWVPLIGLFSGMRLNEICQLTLDDFAIEDGINIILIRGSDDETKRVKSEAGERFVPVHQDLIRMGLLEYVAERREKAGQTAAVFPELSLGSTGYRSDPFSKFFARFLDHVGVRHKKKVFHSFRHNYRDALRDIDHVSIQQIQALGGWNSGGTEEEYGTEVRPRKLAKVMGDVRYPGLDLSHLFVK